jgi:Flp pilus assembly protein TadG
MRTPVLLEKFARTIHAFSRAQSGNVAVIFAISLVPMVAAVGGAVDYSRANSIKSAMQAALDATALMLVKSAESGTPDQLNDKATAYFKAVFKRPEAQNIQITAQFGNEGGLSVSVSGASSLPTDFLGLMGLPTLQISASAVAVSNAGGLGCVLALNRTISGAITAQGSTTVVLDGCSLFDNSNSGTALTVGGSAKVSALSVSVVGGISGNAGVTATQGVWTGQAPMPDPYAKVVMPSFFGCDQRNFNAKSTVTIEPGVYCSGISLNAGAEVTMRPGIYFLDRGDLTVNGGSTLKGAGVTLVFTSSTASNWATATINGNANVNLTPPTTGPTAGIVVFGDRNIPVGTTYKLNGGSTQFFGGAIYIPTGEITFAGGAGTSTSCTQIIGDTITFVGNSNLAINCKDYATKTFGSPVVRLAR